MIICFIVGFQFYINRIKDEKARNVKVKFDPRPPQNNDRTKYKLEIFTGRIRTRYLQISGRFEISLPERIFLCLIYFYYYLFNLILIG